MTRQRVFGSEPPFNSWMRRNLRDAQDGLAITDLDAVLYDWKSAQLRLLEVKTRGGRVRFAQRDILNILNNLLASVECWIITARGKRKIRYRGLHLLTLSGTTPDDSQEILLNGVPVTKEELTAWLNFERDLPEVEGRDFYYACAGNDQ